jgi:hypothetical protein
MVLLFIGLQRGKKRIVDPLMKDGGQDSAETLFDLLKVL